LLRIAQKLLFDTVTQSATHVLRGATAMKFRIYSGLLSIVTVISALFMFIVLAQHQVAAQPEAKKGGAEKIKQVAKLEHGFQEPKTIAVDISFSPDGKTLAALYQWNYRSGVSNKVALWDVSEKKKLAVIDLAPDAGSATDAHSVIFSPDGKMLAVAHRDVIKIFDVMSREIQRSFPLKRFASVSTTSLPDPIAISPDSKTLTVATLTSFEFPSEIHFFDLTSGKVTNTIKSDGEPLRGGRSGGPSGKSANYWGVTFSSDGKRMATSRDDKVQVWDAKNMKEIRSFPVRRGHGAVISPDGALIAVSTTGTNRYPGQDTLAVYDVSTGKKRVHVGNFTPVPTTIFSPNGKLLIFGSGRTVENAKYVPVDIMNVETNQVIGNFDVPAMLPRAATNGSVVAVADFETGAISLWDISSLSK
jgi:WD40 repeat protein